MRRPALACALLIATLVSAPMLYQVVVTRSLSSEVALQRYVVVLFVSLFAGRLLASAFSSSSRDPAQPAPRTGAQRRSSDIEGGG